MSQSGQRCGIGFEFGGVGEETLRDHIIGIEPVKIGEMGCIKLGVILHCPDLAIGQRNERGLHFAMRIGGEQGCAFGQSRYLVIVDARRVKDRTFARKHRVVASGLGHHNLARKADFTAHGMIFDQASCCHRRDLQAPAAAEYRQTNLGCFADQGNLVGDGEVGVIGMEPRPADNHAVISGQRIAARDRVFRIENINLKRGKMREQRLAVDTAGRPHAHRCTLGAPFGDIAFHQQYFAHAVSLYQMTRPAPVAGRFHN